MTILIDYSQVFISNMMKQIAVSDQTLNPALIRHMVFRSLAMYRKMFSKKYGELVICCDSSHSWRKNVFPHYKASRKKDRAESTHDWKAIFEILDEIRTDIRDHLPYKVISYPHAEADDIIASLVMEYGHHDPSSTAERVLIVSGDKDFIQLLHYDNVDQYSPVLKKFITEDNPDRFLKQHIILGDRSDGIPNILSADDTFVVGGRQKPVSKLKLDEWSLLSDHSKFCSPGEMQDRYLRNKTLIDLTQIPEEIRSGILNTYTSYEMDPDRRKNLIAFFLSRGLSKLVENVGDF